MHIRILFLINVFLFQLQISGYSQTVIKMKREGGVSIIPCKVNGLNLSFIFDTGASDVTISLVEASFMLKNGYLDKKDIIGSSKYSDATGNISEGIVINLKEIEICGLKLYNVRAAIVKEIDAPLLLGQSALSKLGKIQFDLVNNTLTIINTPKTKYTSNNGDFTKNKWTSEGSSYCTDYDGNHYSTVIIGNQEWTKSNLNVKHFRNGNEIQEAKTDEDWDNDYEQKIPAWCYYNYDPTNEKLYGKLYNWYAVIDYRELAPKGWHIPSDSEWTILIKYLGGESVAGKKMKASHGWEYKGNGTNESNFTGLPGGWRILGFGSMGNLGGWWSTSEALGFTSWSMYFSMDCYRESEMFGIPQEAGLSVRCLKD
jgi:clan AA aspartic protease (TIGR02281 family)